MRRLHDVGQGVGPQPQRPVEQRKVKGKRGSCWSARQRTQPQQHHQTSRDHPILAGDQRAWQGRGLARGRRRPDRAIRVDRVRTGSPSANEAGRRVGSTNKLLIQVGDRHRCGSAASVTCANRVEQRGWHASSRAGGCAAHGCDHAGGRRLFWGQRAAAAGRGPAAAHHYGDFLSTSLKAKPWPSYGQALRQHYPVEVVARLGGRDIVQPALEQGRSTSSRATWAPR